MDITFNCNACGQSVSVDETCAGQTGECPKCGQLLTVPNPDASQAPAVASPSRYSLMIKNKKLMYRVMAIVLGLIGILGLISYFGIGANPNARSNKLYVEAVRLCEESENMTPENLSSAGKAAGKALAKIEEIVQKWKESDLAVKIIQGQPIYKDQTYAQLKPKLIQRRDAGDSVETPDKFWSYIISSNGKDGASRVQLKMVRRMVESGNVDEAITVANKIKGDSKNIALTHIIAAFSKSGNLEKVSELAEQVNGDKDTALEYLAETLAKHGKNEEAMRTIDRMKNKARGSWALRGFIKELARNGKLDIALGIIAQKSNANELMVCVVEGLAESGNVEKAISEANKLGGFDKSGAMEAIAKAMTGKGDVEKAIREANKLGADDKSDFMSAIVKGLARKGDVEKAVELVDNLKLYHDLTPLCEISIAFAKKGNKSKSNEFFNRALKLAGDIETEYFRASAFINIGEAMVEAGEAQRAVNLIRNMKSTTNDETLAISRNSIRMSFLESMIKSGDVDKAIGFLKELENDEEQSLSSAVSELARKGYYKQSLDAANRLKDPSSMHITISECVANHIALDENGFLKDSFSMEEKQTAKLFVVDFLKNGKR